MLWGCTFLRTSARLPASYVADLGFGVQDLGFWGAFVFKLLKLFNRKTLNPTPYTLPKPSILRSGRAAQDPR